MSTPYYNPSKIRWGTLPSIRIGFAHRKSHVGFQQFDQSWDHSLVVIGSQAQNNPELDPLAHRFVRQMLYQTEELCRDLTAAVLGLFGFGFVAREPSAKEFQRSFDPYLTRILVEAIWGLTAFVGASSKVTSKAAPRHHSERQHLIC